MTAVDADLVPTDALYRWEDIITAKPTHRCVLRWTKNGLITPARPSTGPGNPTRYSTTDAQALVRLRRLQANWDVMFPMIPLPPRLVSTLWDAVHENRDAVGVGYHGVSVEISVKGLR